MSRSTAPVTAAVRVLRAAGIEYTAHRYRYEAASGAPGGAVALGLDPHVVVKTLVMETSDGDPLVVLMHGDRSVSTKRLARLIGVKAVRPSETSVAQRRSGYQVGGTSPFGLREPMPIFMERTIADLERVYLNGGSRGFLVGLTPADVVAVLSPTLVDVAVG